MSCDWFKEKKPELNAYQNRILGSALQQVGTYLNGTSEKEKAIAYYNKAIEIYPTAVAYFNRGVSYNQLKKRKKALKSFEEAVKHDPEMHSCWSMIGMIYLMKKEYFKSMHAYVVFEREAREFQSFHTAMFQSRHKTSLTHATRKSLENQRSNTQSIMM